MSKDLTVALRLLADPSGLDAGLRHGESSVHHFTSGIKREFDALGRTVNSFYGRLGQIGVTLSVGDALLQSARLDKGLTQLRQTAGEAQTTFSGVRDELFAMGKQTGTSIEDLKSGEDSLIASGESLAATQQEIQGINIAMAVSGANAKTLAAGLSVASNAFQFDLKKPGLAFELLDKMTVAGRKGNAELENLSDIFARVGVNSQSAGLGFEKTLAFIETLSLVERQPERLATLADSTLRLFNNIKYMETAQEASHVKFFDDKGGRRDPVSVLRDLRTQYRLLKSDQKRSDYIGNTFDKMDLDTQKGLKTLLAGNALDKVVEFEQQINAGVGTLQRDLPGALNNAVDQAGRLRNTLREAADGFAQPINKAVADLIKYGLDTKKLNGTDLMVGGAGLAAATYVGGRMIKGVGGSFLRGIGSTAIGVAEGKALEKAAGITPVFVTNWPSGLGSSLLAGLGSSAAGASGGALVGAGLKSGATSLMGIGMGGGAEIAATAGAGAGAGAVATWGIPAEIAALKIGLRGILGASVTALPGMGAGALATGAAGVGLAGAAGYTAGTIAYHAMPVSWADRIGFVVANAISPFSHEAKNAIALNENLYLQAKLNKINDDTPILRKSVNGTFRTGDEAKNAIALNENLYLQAKLNKINDDTPILRKSVNGTFRTGDEGNNRQIEAINNSGRNIEQKLQQFKPDMESAINSSKLADRIGQHFDLADRAMAEKKADLTIRIVGQPAKVEKSSATGFNLNIDSGIMGFN